MLVDAGKHAHKERNAIVIEAQTIAIWDDEKIDGGETPVQLTEALLDFAKSPAARRLIRKSEEQEVKCELRVPLLNDCRVLPDELSRALGTVWGAAIDAGKPGENFMIDLCVEPGSRLVVQAQRGGPLFRP
ncbi:hypothetical protein [Microvirga tunisiensis]|uniref:Uncharacterized protein n=1 Tax=Microvirga tunisiensis TaxID=2108360 RepID=A0A5N7MLN3_9HYPH|nr:hypothetical protein [Microvirga tunisiensis]MPR08871.1 hypothetical protein [Microvirga tunisiensis]MPR27054.1 hypothetical protein [Microvirga tunisiensis]